MTFCTQTSQTALSFNAILTQPFFSSLNHSQCWPIPHFLSLLSAADDLLGARIFRPSLPLSRQAACLPLPKGSVLCPYVFCLIWVVPAKMILLLIIFSEINVQ